ESDAVGFVGAPFLNLVVSAHTELDVAPLLHELRRIEQANGYAGGAAKFSARSLDLDLLLYGELRGCIAGAQLPRGDITRYAYALWPLADMAGDTRHPLLGVTYAALRAQFPHCQSLRRVPFVWGGADLSC